MEEDYRSKMQRFREVSANNNNNWTHPPKSPGYQTWSRSGEPENDAAPRKTWTSGRQAWGDTQWSGSDARQPWVDKFPVSGPDVDNIEQDIDSEGDEADVGDDELTDDPVTPESQGGSYSGSHSGSHSGGSRRGLNTLHLDLKKGLRQQVEGQQSLRQQALGHQDLRQQGDGHQALRQQGDGHQGLRLQAEGHQGLTRLGGGVAATQPSEAPRTGFEEGSLLQRFSRMKQNRTPQQTQNSALHAHNNTPLHIQTDASEKQAPGNYLRGQGWATGNIQSFQNMAQQNQDYINPRQQGQYSSPNQGQFQPNHEQFQPNYDQYQPNHAQFNSQPYHSTPTQSTQPSRRQLNSFTSPSPQPSQDVVFRRPLRATPDNKRLSWYSALTQNQANGQTDTHNGPSNSYNMEPGVLSPEVSYHNSSPFHSTPKHNQSYYIPDGPHVNPNMEFTVRPNTSKRKTATSNQRSPVRQSQSFNAGRPPSSQSGRETPQRRRWNTKVTNYKLATSTGELRSSTGNLSMQVDPRHIDPRHADPRQGPDPHHGSLAHVHRSNSNRLARQMRQVQQQEDLKPKSYTVSMVNLSRSNREEKQQQQLSPRSVDSSESNSTGYASMSASNHSNNNRPSSTSLVNSPGYKITAPSPKLTVHPVPVYSDQTKLDEALLSSGQTSDALNSLQDWLHKAELYLAENQPILGDLDTVNILIEQHKAFQQELNARQSLVDQIASGDIELADEGFTLSPAQIQELTHTVEHVYRLSEVREARLQEALRLAEDFSEAVAVIREWLPSIEAELKFKSHAEDEEGVLALMDKHQGFQDELQSKQPEVERIRNLAEEILQSCHPNAVRFVRYYLTITHVRWEQALSRAEQKGQKLEELLSTIRSNTALMQEHLAWLSEALALLTTKEQDSIPDDLTVVEALLREQNEFHEDLSSRSRDIEKLTSGVAQGDSKRKSIHGSQLRLNDDECSGHMTNLHHKWKVVWSMSSERKQVLQDKYDQLMELENFKNFDFETWRQRYNNWIKMKKLRITDFFRRQDKEGYGTLSRDQFVKGMLSTNFPTNATELHAVFDMFDQNQVGEINYTEFINSLRMDKRGQTDGWTDTQRVQHEIDTQVSQCQCRQQFKVNKIEEGKYKFGERQKLYLVRFLNNTVMVRVGGGWITLREFLSTNDPCRAINSRLSSSIHSLSNSSRISSARSETNLFTGGNLAAKNRSGSTTNLSNRPTTPKVSTPARSGQQQSGRRTPLGSESGRRTPSATSGRTTPTSRARTPSSSKPWTVNPKPTTVTGTPGSSARPATSTPGSGNKTGSSDASQRADTGRRTPSDTGRRTPSDTGRRTPTGLRSSTLNTSTKDLVRDRPITKSLSQKPMRF